MSLYLLTYFIIILLLLFIPTFPSHRLNIKPILHFVANLHRGELICLPKWSHTVHLFLYYYYVRTYLTISQLVGSKEMKVSCCHLFCIECHYYYYYARILVQE